MNHARTIALVFSLIVSWPVLVSAQEVHWYHNLNAAKAAAKAQQRPLLLDFGTVNCYWCRQLDATTFRDPSIVKLVAERIVAVKIDASKDPALVQSMGVSAFPTLIFMTPEGKLFDRHEGYLDAAKFQAQLLKAVAGYSPKVTAPAAAKAIADSMPTTRFVLPTPEQLGIGTKLYPPADKQETLLDGVALFARLREVGAKGFHLERVGDGYKARIDVAGPQNQSISVEGQGPTECAAIVAALARIAK